MHENGRCSNDPRHVLTFFVMTFYQANERKTSILKPFWAFSGFNRHLGVESCFARKQPDGKNPANGKALIQGRIRAA